MPMQTVNVESSHLAQIGYDLEKQLLQVQFKDGATYESPNFPQAVFQQWITAPSKGKFYHQHIKNNYTLQKASGGSGAPGGF